MVVNVFFGVLGVLCLVYVTVQVARKRFNEAESLLWQGGAILVLVLAVFPDLLIWVSDRLGVDYPPSLLFLLCALVFFFMNLRQSVKLNQMDLRIKELGQHAALQAQRISILEENASKEENP